MYKLAVAFISLFFLAAGPANAAGKTQDNWVVMQLSGDARVVHPGAQPASLKVNSQLSPGDMLVTGPTGRATVVHGGDYIIVAPRSELRLPSAQQPSGFTRVIQNLGTLLFKVQHTGIPHFAVDTPMLAAVVKGTTFTVVVDQRRSAIQVIQGVVQVSAIDGGMTRMVEGGRTIFINHDHPTMLFDADKPAPPARAPSSTSVTVSVAGDSPLSTIASLTGGLVRPDLTSPPPAVSSPVATPVVETVVANASPPPSTPGTGPNTSPAPVVKAEPPASSPSVGVGTTTIPNVTAAPITTPTVAAPSGTGTPATTPAVTTPAVTTPVVTAPAVTVASVTTPVVTTPAVTVPSVTTPVVTTPTVTTPTIITTAVTTPTITTPTVTTPTVTTPTVTAPVVTTASVTVPVITAQPVTVPIVTTGSNSGPGSIDSGSGSINSGPGSVTSGSSGSGGGLISGLLNTVGTTLGTVTGTSGH